MSDILGGMIERVVTVLNSLLAGPEDVPPVVLEECRRFVERPAAEGELSAEYDRFLALLDDAVARVAREWGPADFVGTGWDEGYPAWADALTIAVWRKSGREAYLGFTHPDHESALALVAGVRVGTATEEVV